MGTDKKIIKSIHINAGASKVWNALTNPDMISQWLYGTNVISDWKAGDPIRFTGSWNGVDYEDKGIIQRIENEKVFEYSYWSGFSGLPDSSENYSLIHFLLAPEGSSTKLTLMHSNFATDTMYEHTEKNWDESLAMIKRIIESE
jgi:uncharacterized protein YndB with AHSA1/START domain